MTTATVIPACVYCAGPNDLIDDAPAIGSDGRPTCDRCYCGGCGNGHTSEREAEQCGDPVADPQDPDHAYDLTPNRPGVAPI